jgi:uncharacterized protein YdeI (YjbR/CyaY-like superfamily)
MTEKQELPVIHFYSQQEWEQWLEEYHETSDGVWLQFAKKDSGIESVSYKEAVDSALCYGWIDGQARPLDGNFWLQRFTRRRSKSKWSQINCGKIAELTAQGRMKEAGLREVERAKADGRWEQAYASPRTITVPDDFQQKLDEHPRARDFFATLSSSNRYAILYRIHEAKKPETRAGRIEKFIAMLLEGRTIHG